MMDLFETAQATRGTAFGANVMYGGVSTDTRTVCAGELFVALAGERFDGHAFLAEARARGAVAALVDADRVEKLAALGMPLVAVDDTRRALGRLAGYWRRKFALPLIAVTGSNGKTTTKEMIGSILRAQAVLDGMDPDLVVLATRGNFNNDIGLPLTLLKLRGGHRFAIVEMGMNHPGEIAYLTRLAAPTVGVVTNAQRAHLEGMGALAEVAREKGTLFENLSTDGAAVINVDDAQADLWRQLAGRRRQIGFSLGGAAEVSGRAELGAYESQLHLALPGSAVDIRLRSPGEHNARNAVAAAAAAFAAGLPAAAIAAGLDAFRGVQGRLQRRAGANGAILLDDTYNANPDSVRAGIDVLARTAGNRLLVLGDMGEIGADAARYHEEIGNYARERGIDRLFTLGETSALAAQRFGASAAHYREPEPCIAAVRRFMDANTVVLVKGSRFMRMERVVAGLLDPAESAHHGETH